jgi:hypothetical protein
MYELVAWKDTYKYKAVGDYFRANGVYCKYPKNSLRYKRFWRREEDRIINGITIDDRYICGDAYFYLNYVPMKGVDVSKVKKGSKNAVKEILFPDFWDLDLYYFDLVNRCISLGKHLSVLKARRKGFSYKNGSLCARRMYFYPNSKCFILAQRESTLTDYDGILYKCWDILDHLDKHTPFKKRRQYKNTPLHKKASYKKVGDEAEYGFKSEIIGVVVGDDPDKVRGINGDIILYEEAGAFKNLKATFSKVNDAVKQGDFVTGLQIAFGTAGTKDAENFAGLNDMFVDPSTYGMIELDLTCFNDTMLVNPVGGFFVPDNWGYQGYIDKDGNSLLNEAYDKLYNELQIVKDKGKTEKVFSMMQENPLKPSWALQTGSNNYFPVAPLIKRILELKQDTRKHERMKHGIFTRVDKSYVFKQSTKLRPILSPYFKLTRENDIDCGCATIWEFPYKDPNGFVPDNLYSIVYDSIAGGPNGTSLACAYVVKNINPFSKPDLMIVAKYYGRPSITNANDFINDQVFGLAAMYNAKIAFENDRGDAVLEYAKKHKQTKKLYTEFSFAYNSTIKKTTSSHKYGFSINSGKGGERKLAAIGYLADLLETPVTKNTLFIDHVEDEILLTQMKDYRDDVNADCVSAIIGYPLVMKELEYTSKKVMAEKNKSSILQKRLF